MSYIDSQVELSQQFTSLRLELSTVKANDADSDDNLYVNVVFADGTRLYEPYNYKIESLPNPGNTKSYDLPVPTELDLTLGDVSELYIRKDGDDGWLVGSVLLFANEEAGITVPLIGNRHVNQFLDSDNDVLRLRDWSTSSLCVAQASNPKFPLVPSGYRILGPVIGPVSNNSAIVIYRVEREGIYKFTLVDAVTHATVHNESILLDPTHVFKVVGLQARRTYNFDLKFVRAGQSHDVPDAAGTLTTYPSETSGEPFTFAFGSCANSDQQEAQGAWTSIRRLARIPRSGMSPARLFLHLGDTFYFYDQMTEERPHNEESMHAAHSSMRRHIEFLNMAREVPCCGVWDDHDFAGNNLDSTAIPDLRDEAERTWRQYWGNQPLDVEHDDFGITSLISYGLVDIYLLDGRFFRDHDHGVCFTQKMIHKLADTIDQRSQNGEVARVVVLATGSNWTHEVKNDSEDYGSDDYTDEREDLFKVLSTRIGNQINGVILLSGDNHINEVFHVNLGNGKKAPEFSVSPFTMQDDVEDEGRDIEGERVWSHATGGKNGKRGFATLTIDPSVDTRDNWKATVRFFQEAFASQYQEITYETSNGEFILTSADPPLP
jgi:hypothetical protein